MKKSSAVVVALALASGATAQATKTKLVPPPPACARVIDRVQKAIEAHDFATLQRLMAPRFLYGAVKRNSADVILQWKKDATDLEGLTGWLLDCHPESDGIVYCPSEGGLIDPENPIKKPDLRFELHGGRWLWTTWHPY